MAKKPAAKKASRKPAKSKNPLVGIVMGSQSDWETMHHAADTLKKLGIAHEVAVHSAHRTPDRLVDWIKDVEGRGAKVFIAGAGMAAALPGCVAAMTAKPVFGCPMETRVMGGMDSLLSMVQMPGGIPVGVLAVGRAGAVNAALLSAAVLALGDEKIAKAVDKFRANQTKAVPLTPN
ncbi:MAG: 5-(carboxyamino)imidazole ribonucleotide mutase [Alphaproteobacteria bacterium]|nr:5-(carboxyamino)imidazole ribonucleotide mutase [Alphaproteobacteria bacterium]